MATGMKIRDLSQREFYAALLQNRGDNIWFNFARGGVAELHDEPPGDLTEYLPVGRLRRYYRRLVENGVGRVEAHARALNATSEQWRV